jgi:hypothetical protein
MKRWLVKVGRVAWIPVVTSLVAGALAWILVGSHEADYRADLLLVVPATESGTTTPGTGADSSTTSTVPPDILGRPSEAQRLASTYAELIPNDVRTLEVVSAAIDRPLNDVRGQVRAAALPESSLIRVTFTFSSREEVSGALDALQQAVTADNPATPAIAPGSLVFVSSEVPEPVGGAAQAAVPSAVLVAFLFGVFVAVAWSRADPRADSADDVGDVLDGPVFDLDPSDNVRIGQVFRAIAHNVDAPPGGVTTLVVMAVSRRSNEAARGVAGLLHANQPSTLRAAFGGTATGGLTPVSFVDGDAVLLVAARGERIRLLTRAIEGIRRLGGSIAGTVVVLGRLRPDSPAALLLDELASPTEFVDPNGDAGDAAALRLARGAQREAR